MGAEEVLKGDGEAKRASKTRSSVPGCVKR